MWSKEKRKKYNREYMRKYRLKISWQIYSKNYQKKWKKWHKPQLSEYSNQFRKRNLEYYLGLSKVWQRENIEKHKAIQIFNRAVKKGIIKREPCEICGKEKTDGHHLDYDDPFDIIWLCHRHNIQMHRNLFLKL